MSWRDHVAEVDRLAAKARQDTQEARKHKQAIHGWNQETFGNPHALAWSFAAGTLWGAIGNPGLNRKRLRRAAVGVANASVLAWRGTGVI